MSDEKIQVPFLGDEPEKDRRPLRERLAELWEQVRARDAEIAQLARELKGNTLRMAEHENRVVPIEPPRPEPEPLTGWRADVAARLGGRDRLEQLLSIAETRGLDLNKRHDFEEACDHLWRSLGATVSNAKCLDEAVWAYAERERITLTEWEPRSRAEAVRAVARERGDLVGHYGSPPAERIADPMGQLSRAMAGIAAQRHLRLDNEREAALCRSIAFQERPALARAVYDYEANPPREPDPDAERAVQFAEKVAEYLAEQSCAPTPSNRVRAAAAVAKAHPELDPRGRYGWGSRR